MNTYDKVVSYLKSYQELKYNIEFYRNKMGGLKAISYSQEEKGASQDNMMSVYMQKIDDADKAMRQIERFIEDNFVGPERFAIWCRYIDLLENKEISSKMGYSNGYAHQFIKKAIHRYLKKRIQEFEQLSK